MTNTAIPIDDETAVSAIAALAQTAVAPKKHPHDDGLPFVIVPVGHRVEPLPLAARPPRRRGAVKLRDAGSFIQYIQRYVGPDTLLYAQLAPARFVAILNDHPRPIADDDGGGWRDWRADFTVPQSHEWERWLGANKKPMGQIGFAEFIEDNLPDIVYPDGAQMLEIVLSFQAAKNATFKSVARLRDGSVNFQWVEDNDTGTLAVPSEFRVEIPVFENGQNYPLTARLKYRLPEGKLSIWFELVRPHKIIEAAFKDQWMEIETATNMKILLGTPE